MNEETNQHRLLKNRAKELLIEMGFNDEEIYEEFSIIPDVVGLKEGKTVAIECGSLSSPNKLEILSLLYDEVIHLPYSKNSIYSTIRVYLEDRNRLNGLGRHDQTHAEILHQVLNDLEALELSAKVGHQLDLRLGSIKIKEKND